MSTDSPGINVTINGHLLEGGLVRALTRLEVRESDFDATVAALRFTLVQRLTGEVFPLDDELFRPLARLSVELAAPGGSPTYLFEGFITHVRPHFEGIEANCYVEVLAMDAAVLLGAHERVATYPEKPKAMMTDTEAVEQVFRRYGIPVSGDHTVARYGGDKQQLVQRSTDWDFVRQLAKRNGFCCYLEPGSKLDSAHKVQAYFGRRKLGGTPQPDLSLLRGDANLLWLDFQVLATGPVRYVASAIDPVAKRIVRSDGTSSLKRMGHQRVHALVEEGLASAKVADATALIRDPAPLDAAIQAECVGASEQAQLAVQVRGEVDAAKYRGLLRARRPVLIKGVGRAYAGTYYVRSVRTSLVGLVLHQAFVGYRNALGLLGNEPFGQQEAEGNF